MASTDRRRFLLVAGGCVALGVGIARVQSLKRGWVESRSGARREWVRGRVTHLDEDGNGRVDEVMITDEKTGRRTVRRDTDRDGYLDVQYDLSESGWATNLANIRQRAPRH